MTKWYSPIYIHDVPKTGAVQLRKANDQLDDEYFAVVELELVKGIVVDRKIIKGGVHPIGEELLSFKTRRDIVEWSEYESVFQGVFHFNQVRVVRGKRLEIQKMIEAVENPFQQKFMVDIETTGVSKETDDILELAVLELQWPREHSLFWVPASFYQTYIYTDRQPENAFARREMQELYDHCNSLDPSLNYGSCREGLISYFDGIGVKRPFGVQFMGNAAANFDVPFMIEKDVIKGCYYEQDPKDPTKEHPRGDCHYRVHDQQGGIDLATKVTGIQCRSELSTLCRKYGRQVIDCAEFEKDALNQCYGSTLKAKAHRALFDCFDQMHMENGLIQFLRRWTS